MLYVDYLDTNVGIIEQHSKTAMSPQFCHFHFICSFRRKLCQTRMHSSRMRTARTVTGGRAWFYLGGMRGFIWGWGRAWFYSGGHAWFYSGGHAWFYLGGHAWFYSGGHVWFYLGGMHGFIPGRCVVLFGGCAWFYLGGMHGFIWGGMQGFIQGACVVLFGGHVCFYSGGAWQGWSCDMHAPAINRITDRCKNTTFANYVCGR